jgi:hypothetical protein
MGPDQQRTASALLIRGMGEPVGQWLTWQMKLK